MKPRCGYIKNSKECSEYYKTSYDGGCMECDYQDVVTDRGGIEYSEVPTIVDEVENESD